VRFLNEVGGGTVMRILDKRTVAVETDDGFEIPALESDLVIVGSASDELLKNGNNKPKPYKAGSKTAEEGKQKEQHQPSPAIDNSNSFKPATDPEGDSVGLFLAFVPVSKEAIHLHIVNDSPYRLMYCLSVWKSNQLEPIKAGELLPDTKESIREYAINELVDPFTINIQAIFFKNTRFRPQQPEYFDINLNPVKFQRGGVFAENDFFEEKAYIISVADSKKEAVLQSITEKAIDEAIRRKADDRREVKKTTGFDAEEIDLHIEALIENSEGLTPGEIIQIQLARFETALEGGLRGKTRRMIFIHGIGNGKLKLELRKTLDQKYPKLKYQDASFKEYGYGATLVHLK